MTNSTSSTKWPPNWPPAQSEIEWERCHRSANRFLSHCHLKDRTEGKWLPFLLWDVQAKVLSQLTTHDRLVILKSRQLGFTWLVLAWALHRMLFQGITVLLFSQRDDEAKDLMARLVGMHERLPAWLQQKVVSASTHSLKFANGAEAMSFPTTAGRSYTAGLAIIDEADYVPDLPGMLNAVGPTVDAGGQLILLSTSDKSKPESAFKRIYRAAREKANGFHPIFHGWKARPGRTDEWYESQKRDYKARTGSLDDLHQEHPDSEEEALAPRSLDKRIPAEWLLRCYISNKPLTAEQIPADVRVPAVPGLEVYALPVAGRCYVIGADPAEGNPTSDDSAAEVIDVESGEQVAALAGKIEPGQFAGYLDLIGAWYNGSAVMVERNNHGHAVLNALRTSNVLLVIHGHDGRPGWPMTHKSKVIIYDLASEAFRHQETRIHSFVTLTQLQSIDGTTLRAPENQYDDRAMAYVLALAGVLRVLPAVRAGKKT